MAAVLAGLGAMLVLVPLAAQNNPSASRSFSADTVEPDETLTVTIEASGYGLAGGVSETLPDGFVYAASSLPSGQVTELSGNRVRFTLQGNTSFTYVVRASMTPGTYTFSGTLRDIDRQDHDVTGDSTVTVEAPAEPTPTPTPTPSPTPVPWNGKIPVATRSLSADTVAPGGPLTVTIIEAEDYGQAGGVTETLPAGFTYVYSSLPANQVNVSGQDVRFTLISESSFTYNVTASVTEATYNFSGKLRDDNRVDHDVGGDSSVTVEAVASATVASRSFSADTVVPGGTLTVTLTATGYGQAGGVTETLPAGFVYDSSSLPSVQVNATGQEVRFTLQGESSFTYDVIASMTAAAYTFSGTLRDFDRADHNVGGDSSVTVMAPQPTASRTFSAPAVAPGASLTVTIEAAHYGQAGGVTETLPAGFAYENSSLPAVQVNATGQEVRFTLQGESSFTYEVNASMTEATYTFSGMLRDFEREDRDVGGDSSIVVEIPSPRANRSFSSAEVEPGDSADGDNRTGLLRTGWRSDRDAAHRVHLRVQQSGRRPGGRTWRQPGQVHPARGGLLHIHGHRVDD